MLVGDAFADAGWPARLLSREVLSPSSHLHTLMTQEIGPKQAVVQHILGDVTGLPSGDPALVRCMVSVAAPCLMLVVAGSGVPGPAREVRQMPKDVLAKHLHTFAMAGLAAIGAERQAELDAVRKKRGR